LKMVAIKRRSEFSLLPRNFTSIYKEAISNDY
jgi:hypothetical protein